MSNTLDNNPPSSEDPFSAPDTEPDPTPDADLQVAISVDPDVDCGLSTDRCVEAVIAAAVSRGFTRGEIGIRVTSDRAIRELNARHLGHDYETDVISFAYECQNGLIVGELVASADTARQRASELGWSADDELLLYIVHGVLHVSGMDDREADDRAEMRNQECDVMLQLGVDQIVRFGADMQIESPEPADPATEATP